MWLLKIGFIFVLVQVISCLTYDDLARDECFKKVYVCGDYRLSVTEGTGRLATEPHRFSEICRKNKEFIACVEEAAHFCSGKLTDVSRRVLENRRSLKQFCTELEWKRKYFSSAKCINDNEKAIKDECIKEENEHVDDRPYCLIREPCEDLERVFVCAVRKMKQLCGSIAAEVYRKMHILKMENRDIVCEIRQRNPVYCGPKQSQTKSVKRIGSLSVGLSEAINKIFETTLVDTMDNFALLLNEENISNLLDSDEYKLRKSIFEAEVEAKFSPFFKKCQLPEGEVSQQPDLSARSFSLIFGNIKKILSEISLQSHKFGFLFYENFLKSCGTENLVLTSCLEKLNELEALKSLNPMAKNSKELDAELKSLKDYILGLFELLNCNEDFLVNSISEDTASITWDNMNSFPIQTLSCEWKDEHFKEVFKCSFKLKPSDQTLEDIQPDIMESAIVESTINGENVNDFIKSLVLESSQFTDSGSGMAGDFIASTDEQETELDSFVTDTLDSEVDVHDIHRSGQRMVFQEEIESEEESGDVKRKSFDVGHQNVNQLYKKGDNGEQSMEETTYILVDPLHSPTDSGSYLTVDATSNTATSIDSSANSNSESGVEVDTEKNNLEKENIKLQLDKIVNALNERFADVEVKVFDSKGLRPDPKKRRQKLDNFKLHSRGDKINKSSQTELEDFLKEKLNEYTEIYSFYSKPPTNTKSDTREARTKRRAINERQNSKMDKSFTVKSSNESVRTNSKFLNFKAEL